MCSIHEYSIPHACVQLAWAHGPMSPWAHGAHGPMGLWDPYGPHMEPHMGPIWGGDYTEGDIILYYINMTSTSIAHEEGCPPAGWMRGAGWMRAAGWMCIMGRAAACAPGAAAAAAAGAGA